MTEKALKMELWPIENLTPYELNAKKHEKDQIERIAASIEKGGFDVPIVVDKHGVIIKGHGRRLALMHLGRTHAAVIIRDDLTPEQVKAARLNDNRAAVGDIDSDMLRMDLADIDREGLAGVWDTKELGFLDADLGTMNVEAFVDDMDKVIKDQKAATDELVEKASTARVSLSKAFGFKDLPAAGQIAITNLMAKAEAATGLRNEAALVTWAGAL